MGSDASSHNNEKNSSQVEFNFKQDPESDWMVLNNTNKSSTVLSIETVYIHPISKVISISIYELYRSLK